MSENKIEKKWLQRISRINGTAVVLYCQDVQLSNWNNNLLQIFMSHTYARSRNYFAIFSYNTPQGALKAILRRVIKILIRFIATSGRVLGLLYQRFPIIRYNKWVYSSPCHKQPSGLTNKQVIDFMSAHVNEQSVFVCRIPIDTLLKNVMIYFSSVQHAIQSLF